MPATVHVVEGNGLPVEWTVLTGEPPITARYCTMDSPTPGTNNPCVVPEPPNVFYYSYWKHHALQISGTYTQITNIRWFTDGSIDWQLGTGGMVMVALRDSGDNGCPPENYDQARGQQGTTGYYLKDPTNGHSYYKNQISGPANAEDFTANSPLIVDTSTYSGNVTATKAVVTQVKIAQDAVQGVKPAETFTFKWDEI